MWSREARRQLATIQGRTWVVVLQWVIAQVQNADAFKAPSAFPTNAWWSSSLPQAALQHVFRKPLEHAFGVVSLIHQFVKTLQKEIDRK